LRQDVVNWLGNLNWKTLIPVIKLLLSHE